MKLLDDAGRADHKRVGQVDGGWWTVDGDVATGHASYRARAAATLHFDILKLSEILQDFLQTFRNTRQPP